MYGGWSSISQFANCFLFCADKKEWCELDVPIDTPRWNHTATMVPALPNWKIFVFGGSTGYFEEGAPRNFGSLTDSIIYLNVKDDLKGQKWLSVSMEDQKVLPSPRENASLIYDQDDQRLVLFGGWSNNYLGDIYQVNISNITGPEYAIYRITPNLGPLTGKTNIVITGEGFKGLQTYNVRFTYGKFFSDVQAVFVSETEITAQTPNFEAAGAKEAEVRIKADRQDLTISSTTYKYFLNTRPDKTIAFGPGVLSGNCVGTPTQVLLQARNCNNENRQSGADPFEINIHRSVMVVEDGEEVETKEVVEYEIEDLNNGQYILKYTMPVEGEYYLAIKVLNETDEMEEIRGTPFKATAIADAKPEDNNLNGSVVMSHITQKLKKNEEFIAECKEGIDVSNSAFESDVYSLLKIKENIQKINDNKEKNLLDLEVVEQTLSNLQKEGLGKSKEFEICRKQINDLQGLEKKAGETDKQIASNVKQEANLCKEQIKEFEDKLKYYYLDLKQKPMYKYATGVEASFEVIEKIETDIVEFLETMKKYTYFAEMFEYPEVTQQAQKNLDMITSESEAIKKLWSMIKKTLDKFEIYLDTNWAEVNAQDQADEVKALNKELMGLKGVDRKSNVFVGISGEIKNWNLFLPLVMEMKNEAMIVPDDRHWAKCRELLQNDFQIEDESKLQMFWDFEIYTTKYREMLEEITEQAKQERKIEINLEKIKTIWVDVDWDTFPLALKDCTINQLKMDDDSVEVLEEHQLLIQNIAASKFMAHFETEVNHWQKGLNLISETVSSLSEVQKTWSFLINLFIYSEEVKKELPNESEEFITIDKEVRAILKNAESNKNIFEFSTQDYEDGKTVFRKMEEIAKELAKCQKGLNDFIASKRKVFPRFYFLTMEELLDVLANGNNPILLFAEKNYINKVIQAGDKVDMDTSNGVIIKTMKASVGVETVVFDDGGCKILGKVENYLMDILNGVINSLKTATKRSNKEVFTKDRVAWFTDNYAQLNLLTNNINWVNKVEESLAAVQKGHLEALKTYRDESIKLLKDLIILVQGKLEKSTRQKIMCLITIDTHNRDINEQLITEGVRKADEFQWQSQLKFYWDEAKQDALICIADARLWYYYEYLGNGARLVVTPLTDRIYVTATQALHLKMGCAPAGPAGTGKTESTKD